MHGSEADSKAIAQANELYWSSELSVNQIAEQLDLSKGTLYGMVHPLPAGLWCPDCGTKAVFSNRTEKERGRVTCPECGWGGVVGEAENDAGDTSVTLPTPGETDAVAPPTGVTDPGRKRVLMGGALLGAAAGLALVLWARRR
jgi:hypothetical protein